MKIVYISVISIIYVYSILCNLQTPTKLKRAPAPSLKKIINPTNNQENIKSTIINQKINENVNKNVIAISDINGNIGLATSDGLADGSNALAETFTSTNALENQSNAYGSTVNIVS